VTSYQSLRNAVSRQGGITTPHAIREALWAYLASLRQPQKPLGDGTLCVVDTKGRVRMMTRAEYTEMVHTRKKPRKKRNQSGDLVLEYTAQDSVQVEAMLSKNHATAELDSEFAADFEWLDEYADRQRREEQDDGYHADF
jgi:hypothetical protein